MAWIRNIDALSKQKKTAAYPVEYEFETEG
jgi:hypothetical protein